MICFDTAYTLKCYVKEHGRERVREFACVHERIYSNDRRPIAIMNSPASGSEYPLAQSASVAIWCTSSRVRRTRPFPTCPLRRPGGRGFRILAGGRMRNPARPGGGKRDH